MPFLLHLKKSRCINRRARLFLTKIAFSMDNAARRARGTRGAHDRPLMGSGGRGHSRQRMWESCYCGSALDCTLALQAQRPRLPKRGARKRPGRPLGRAPGYTLRRWADMRACFSPYYCCWCRPRPRAYMVSGAAKLRRLLRKRELALKPWQEMRSRYSGLMGGLYAAPNICSPPRQQKVPSP